MGSRTVCRPNWLLFVLQQSCSFLLPHTWGPPSQLSPKRCSLFTEANVSFLGITGNFVPRYSIEVNMAAAQRAIPSHLRDGAATNGGEAGAFKRNHHQKSQSHMVSLYVPEKSAWLHTNHRKRESEEVPFLFEGRRRGWSRPLFEEVATGSTLKTAAMTSDLNTSFCTVYSSACEYKLYSPRTIL